VKRVRKCRRCGKLDATLEIFQDLIGISKDGTGRLLRLLTDVIPTPVPKKKSSY
jgi:hypothetical protein